MFAFIGNPLGNRRPKYIIITWKSVIIELMNTMINDDIRFILYTSAIHKNNKT